METQTEKFPFQEFLNFFFLIFSLFFLIFPHFQMDSLHHILHQTGRFDPLVGNPLYSTQRLDVSSSINVISYLYFNVLFWIYFYFLSFLFLPQCGQCWGGEKAGKNWIKSIKNQLKSIKNWFQIFKLFNMFNMFFNRFCMINNYCTSNTPKNINLDLNVWITSIYLMIWHNSIY